MLKFKTKDWEGVVGEYKVVALKQMDDRHFLVTFINSDGDLEKCNMLFGRSDD